jgi:hypothetical protein
VSSSILVSVRLVVCSFSLWLSLAPVGAIVQDPVEKKTEEPKPDTFFAGTVIETTADKITVSRVVLGKTEKRVFRVTPDTKCEGKLKAKVRVTVRYVATDDGETAELIIVRSTKDKKNF